jgi:hypothetical protein
VEAVLAAGLFSVAVVAVVQLTALSVGLHADAGEASRVLWYAADGLRALERDGGAVSIGGSLETDTSAFADHPEPGVVRRWMVTKGPVDGTRAVVVRVINLRARRVGRSADVRGVIGVEPEP